MTTKTKTKKSESQIGSHLVQRLPKSRILNMPKKKTNSRRNSLGQN